MAALDIQTPFGDRFRDRRGTLPGAGLAWVDALRDEGIAAFEAAGFPDRKVEAWKYTDLRKLAKLDFAPAPLVVDGLSARLSREVEAVGGDAHLAVFVNGRFRADLSRLDRLPQGVRVASLAELLRADDPLLADRLGRVAPVEKRPFLDLNAALMEDGFVIHLPKGAEVEAPIRVLFLTEGQSEPMALHPRNVIVAEEGARATVVEVHVGTDDAPYFSNGASEIDVAATAVLHHYKLQREGASAFHLANIQLRLDRDATYDSFILSTGAELARNEIYAKLAGSGTECRLSGAYLGRGSQHLDTTTLIDHAVPDCTSREVYKGVLDDAAHGVFQGKIIVRPDAQRTDGYQLNRALLLSRKAEINSKPELEIYADDVKCSHGATVGEIDKEALFYLRSRGIPEWEARTLLVEAFVQDALEEIRVDEVREEFSGLIRDWMAGVEDLG